MSGNWDSDAEPAIPGEAPEPPGADPVPPDVPASVESPEGEAQAPRPFWSSAKRVVAVGLAVVVVAALGAVVTLNAKGSAVKAAYSSVFASSSVKVVISAHSAKASEEAVAGQYAVVLTISSENGGPLSSAGARETYEISVLRNGVDLGDFLADNNALYARVDLQAFDPAAFEDGLRSLAGLPAGALQEAGSAALHDKWVGIKETTINSFVRSLEHKALPQVSTVKVKNLRNAFAMSFAQSWDAWTSIHQLSSRDGVTKYSVKLPVRHFVSSFLKDVRGAVMRDLPNTDRPIASRELDAAASGIDRIPAGLEIPVVLSVTNGSLTGLVVSQKGDSVDLAISHPSVGVTVPRNAVMVTTSMLQDLVMADMGSATASSSSSSSAPAKAGVPPASIATGSGAASGIYGTISGTSGIFGTSSQ